MNPQGRGWSLIEVLVAVSVVTTLSALVFPAVGKVRRHAYVVRCMTNLQQIGLALRLYQEDYGKRPWPLGRLAPDYLDRRLLVCPFLEAMVGSEVIEAQERKCRERFPFHWSSYFAFDQEDLDRLSAEGDLSYSQVLELRRGRTPVAFCRDHRELWSHFWTGVKPSSTWDLPSEPIVVLRLDGTVDLSRRGGTYLHGTAWGTMADALDL